MEFTPIGILALVAAVLVVARPVALGLPVIAAFVPLQAAAIANLPAVGNVSIVCVHFLAGALIAGIALRPRMFAGAFQYSARNWAILLFGAFTAYAVLSAFLMPRLFEGEVSVYSHERTSNYYIALSPLHPTTGNFTQSMYLTISFLVLAAVAYMTSRAGGLSRITHAFNATTIVHLAFAVVSVFPGFPPVDAIFEFIRTANYSIHAHHTLAGAPRIIGSYTEPAAFGSASMGLFAWNFTRFMQTRGLWHFCASTLLLACVAFSLSTTAYAALILLVGLWGLHSVYYLVRPGISSDQITALVFGAVIASCFLLLFFLEPFREFAVQVYERLFGVKLQSDSGVERAAWNVQSLQNFVDTKGFGVGLGSARASSLFAVLIGNVGFIGAGVYIAFLNRSFMRPWAQDRNAAMDPETRYARRIFTASRAAALALILTHLIAGTTIDGGLMYMMFVAAATAAYASIRRPKTVLDVEAANLRPKFSFPKRPRVFGSSYAAGRREQDSTT